MHWKLLWHTANWTEARDSLKDERCILCDSVHPAAHIKKTVWELKFQALDHSSYSPYLACFDFNLFGFLKEVLRDLQFADYSEVRSAPEFADRWLESIEKGGWLCVKMIKL
jgi:hypothetical protein